MIAVTLSTTSCEKRPASLVLERQAIVPAPKGSPNAIARTTTGGLIIAGGRFTPWAIATDADGKPLWKYEEAHDDTVKTQSQGEFKGAVQLPNGNVLLCGETEYRRGGGLIVILDRNGQLVERRTLFPFGDPKYAVASFGGCMPWNGSILLLGTASDGTHGESWFMRLDMAGSKTWELLSPEIPSFRAIYAPDNGLIAIAPQVNVRTVVARLNQNFEVLARRTIESSGAALLRPVDGVSNSSRLVIYTYDGKARLFTLNEKLQDEGEPQPIEGISVDQGCGYVLSDGSLALFGSETYRGMGRAAAAHLGPGRVIEGRALETLDKTPSQSDAFAGTLIVKDVVPVTKSRFIAVSERVSRSAKDAGVVLSWLRFE